jgi:hypothetical protein
MNLQTLKIFVALQGVHNVFEEVYRGSVRYTEKKIEKKCETIK